MTATSSDNSLALQKRTAAHYDAHPLEFLTLEDEKTIVRVQPAPFVDFVSAKQISVVAEIPQEPTESPECLRCAVDSAGK